MWRRRTGVLAGVSALALAFALASCGGSGSDGDFRADAAKVCTLEVPSVASVDRFAGLEPGSRSFADHANAFEAQVETLRKELMELEVPSDLSADFDEFTGHLAEQQRAWQQLGLRTQTPERIRGNLKMLRLSTAYKDAQRLKIDSCVEVARGLALQAN